MRMLRVSVAGLMAIVLFFAVAITALKRASPLWSSGVFTAALALLSTMSLLAIARAGRRRITWGGASLFGWVYLVSAFGVGPPGSPPLITRPLMAEAFHYIYTPDVIRNSILRGDYSWMPDREYPVSMNVVHADSYLQIGHSLGAIAFAFIGALMGGFLAARDERPALDDPRSPTG